MDKPRIVLAPDAYKESMTAPEAVAAMRNGVRAVWPKAVIVEAPMADGGEGTLQILVRAYDAQVQEHEVCGPRGSLVKARMGWVESRELAIIDTTEAAGMKLIPTTMRDPLTATSYGVGELLVKALDLGAKKIVVGLGGTAVIDGGTGMLQALGVKLLDGAGERVGPGGGALAALETIDMEGLDPRLAQVDMVAASDVLVPLTGMMGAAIAYGPRKGASPEQAEQIDEALVHFGELLRKATGREVAPLPGAGAAGGIGAALMATTGVKIRSGVDVIAEACDLEKLMEGADLVLTGEGQLDAQSLSGTTARGIAEVAAKHDIPVLVFGGSLGPGANWLLGGNVRAVLPIIEQIVSLEEAFPRGAHYLSHAVANACRLIQLGIEAKKR